MSVGLTSADPKSAGPMSVGLIGVDLMSVGLTSIGLAHTAAQSRSENVVSPKQEARVMILRMLG